MVYVEERPWGKFEQFTEGTDPTVKLLHIKADKRLSYQYHERRSEFWRVVKGSVMVTIDGQDRVMEEGDFVEVPRGAKHRIAGLTDAVVLEIAHGKFDENDNIRIDDDYGRA